MSRDNMDNSKLQTLRQFVTLAREYTAFRHEDTLNSLSKLLGTITTYDAGLFSPGKLQVSAFFTSLWEVMSISPVPLWIGVSVLSKAVLDPSTRNSLLHTYRFLPVLAKFLTENLSYDKKINILKLMEILSYGIKINWEESYLASLMKLLCDWIINLCGSDVQAKAVSHLALAVLVNLCYGNVQVVAALMRTVDVRELIKRLVSLKEGDTAGVQVCRLLVALQETRGAPTANDVRNFLAVALQAFVQGIKDCDSTLLRHSSSFFDDLRSDSQTKAHVLNYDRYEAPLQEVVKLFPLLLSKTSSENGECEGNMCLESTLKFLLALVNTELYSLRPSYSVMAELCIKSTHVSDCMASVYSLLASIITQYHEDEMLPDEQLMAVLSTKIHGFLAPKSLDVKSCGLEWIQFVSALCECNATQNAVIQNVSPAQFEGIVFEILQSTSQKGSLDIGVTYESVLMACHLSLEMAQISSQWDAVLHKMLSNSSVQKVLSSCLSKRNDRRKRALAIIKHPRFPSDRINQVFCITESSSEVNPSLENGLSTPVPMDMPTCTPLMSIPAFLTNPLQEQALDTVIKRISQSFENNQIEDIATSDIMELYSCKVAILEQRLHASSIALQGATHNVASLNHSMALLQVTSRNQQEVLYRTQLHNEKLKENARKMSEHLGDAERSVKKFQGKLAAERLDRDQQQANSKHKHMQTIKEMENDIENKNIQISSLNTKLSETDANNQTLKNRLAEQTAKNNELAGVLVKFEERVKLRDKKLEETSSQSASIKNELSQANQTIKTMEKTLLEREKRLTQLTSQLEEMNRIQEIIANLMGNKAASTNSSNNSVN